MNKRLKPILDTSGKNYASYMSNTESMIGKTEEEIEEYCKYVDKSLGYGLANASTDADGEFDEDEEESASKSMKPPKLPNKFKFTGGMVFISNMRAKEIEGAIMSRSIFVDVYLAERDVLKRIKSIALAQAKNDPSTSEADVEMIMEALSSGSGGSNEEILYITPEYARKGKAMTVRAYQLANTMRKAGLARWIALSSLYA